MLRLLCRLALMMGRTVRELAAEMGSDELALWMAFDGIYGLGDGHAVAGQLGNTLARVHGSKSSRPWHFAPVLKPDQHPRGNTPQQNRAIMATILAARAARKGT